MPKPAQTVPKPAQTVPKPARTVPKPARTVPKPAQAVPKPAQTVPKPAQAVPKPAKTAPKPAKTAPSAAKLADQALGRRGEDVACATACGRGWQPWQRNARVAETEVDLAMRRQSDNRLELLVAEVKTSRRTFVDASQRWPLQRQRRLWAAAEVLCEQCGADRVEVSLITVVLSHDLQKVTWLQALPPPPSRGW
ncbi:MAG: hypothetical protein EXR77_12305 [Myxococcales bacterium]|nr:hypothetical protein [Myxococcales bacterium]